MQSAVKSIACDWRRTRGSSCGDRRRRGNILLLADKGRRGGGRSDADIAGVLGVGTATVERVRRQCVLEGLEAALERRAQLNRKKRKLDAEAEAMLTALACSGPSDGRARWTLKLLCDRLVKSARSDFRRAGGGREHLRRDGGAYA